MRSVPAVARAAGPGNTGDQKRSVLRSPWIGDVEWHSQCELFFPSGLPGFEVEQRMIPVEIPAQRPLVYLQSLENPAICFVCLPVFVIDPEFELRLSDEDRAALQIPEGSAPAIGDDVLCLGLLVTSEDGVEVNLNAPVVINLRNSRGIQAVGARTGEPARGNGGFRLEADGHWVALC